MKKVLLGLAFAGAILFAAQNAMAQCCDKVFDDDGNPNTPAVGCNTSAPGSTCGCVDVGMGTGTCIGGDASAPAGCIGVGGTYTSGSAAGCAADAAAACEAGGCAS